MVIRILTLIAAMCFASTAQALVSWSIPASACVPDGLTIQGSRHFVQAPSVQHTGSNKDLIVLNCPIAPFSSGATQWNLSLTYRDTTGRDASAYVRAKLWRFTPSTLSTTVLTTVTSDTSSATTSTTLLSPVFTQTFNFNSFVYWVRVEMDRSLASTSETVVFFSASLKSIP